MAVVGAEAGRLRRAVRVLTLGAVCSGMTGCEPSPLAGQAPWQAPDQVDPVRGARWADGVLGCTACHAPPGAMPAVSPAAMASILRGGRSTTGAFLSRAHAVRWRGLSDQDIGDVAAWWQGLATQPSAAPGFSVVRSLASLWPAEEHLRLGPPPDPAATTAYGAYLGQVAGCVACHGADGPWPDAGARTGADFAAALVAVPPGVTSGHGDAVDELELEALWAWAQAQPAGLKVTPVGPNL